MLKISIYFLLLVLFFGCQNEASEKFPEINVNSINLNSTYHLLVFKKEQKFELWVRFQKGTNSLILLTLMIRRKSSN